jgi:hypothetical protein
MYWRRWATINGRCFEDKFGGAIKMKSSLDYIKIRILTTAFIRER